jgi:hypothetical protein
VNKIKYINFVNIIFFSLITIFTLMISSTGQADAAAFTYDVYAPKKEANNIIKGWANLSRDCSGTYGCYNYIKLEYKSWGSWRFFSGKWANANGWNSVSGDLINGCNEYRTTVDSYNDTLVSNGAGANIGPVGANGSGQKIYRFQRTWSSGSAKLCRTAGGGW